MLVGKNQVSCRVSRIVYRGGQDFRVGSPASSADLFVQSRTPLVLVDTARWNRRLPDTSYVCCNMPGIPSQAGGFLQSVRLLQRTARPPGFHQIRFRFRAPPPLNRSPAFARKEKSRSSGSDAAARVSLREHYAAAFHFHIA